MMVDPFRDGFTLTQLSQAMNVLPNMYNRIQQLGLFPWKPQSTKSVTIEMRNGVLALVPTTPWGGPAPKNRSGSRNIRSFAIPHTPLEDTVAAADVIGVRAFGTESTLEVVSAKVNEKLQDMKNKIDQTMEWRQLGALKGIVLDSDGSTVLANYFTDFGVTEKVIDFELDDVTTDVREKTMEVARWLEDNLLGDRMDSVRALVDPDFFDALTKHPSVKAVYQGWAEAQNKLGGDLRKGFTFGAMTFEEYRAVVDGHTFFASGEGRAFPLGTIDTFNNFGAPADFLETVNTLAIPYYARQKNTDFNRGVDIHVQANQLPIMARPALSIKLLA